MKKKTTSEYSLEELLKQKKVLISAMISMGIIWLIIFVLMIFRGKYNLLTTFIPIAVAVSIPMYVSINGINTEIKKRNSEDQE